MDANSTKIFSWKSALLLSFGVGLLAAGLSIFFQVHSETFQGETLHSQPAQNVPADVPKPVAAVPAPMGLGTSFETPGRPVRLVIPAIHVDAAVQSVGLFWRGDGSMGIPTNFTDVAWYNGGPLPGMPGNAVIDGHLDGRKVQKAVFYDLGKLVAGDLVEVIDAGGKTWQFQVVGSKSYDYNASTSDIFVGDASKARLNLITCAGDWVKNKNIYDQRIVVFTELVAPGDSTATQAIF